MGAGLTTKANLGDSEAAFVAGLMPLFSVAQLIMRKHLSQDCRANEITVSQSHRCARHSVQKDIKFMKLSWSS